LSLHLRSWLVWGNIALVLLLMLLELLFVFFNKIKHMDFIFSEFLNIWEW
jgi:hypothetical protein